MEFNSDDNKNFECCSKEGKKYLKVEDKIKINEKKKESKVNKKEEKKLDNNRQQESKEQITGNNCAKKIDKDAYTRFSNTKHLKENIEHQIKLENKVKNDKYDNNDIYNTNKLNNMKFINDMNNKIENNNIIYNKNEIRNNILKDNKNSNNNKDNYKNDSQNIIIQNQEMNRNNNFNNIINSNNEYNNMNFLIHQNLQNNDMNSNYINMNMYFNEDSNIPNNYMNNNNINFSVNSTIQNNNMKGNNYINFIGNPKSDNMNNNRNFREYSNSEIDNINLKHKFNNQRNIIPEYYIMNFCTNSYINNNDLNKLYYDMNYIEDLNIKNNRNINNINFNGNPNIQYIDSNRNNNINYRRNSIIPNNFLNNNKNMNYKGYKNISNNKMIRKHNYNDEVNQSYEYDNMNYFQNLNNEKNIMNFNNNSNYLIDQNSQYNNIHNNKNLNISNRGKNYYNFNNSGKNEKIQNPNFFYNSNNNNNQCFNNSMNNEIRNYPQNYEQLNFELNSEHIPNPYYNQVENSKMFNQKDLANYYNVQNNKTYEEQNINNLINNKTFNDNNMQNNYNMNNFQFNNNQLNNNNYLITQKEISLNNNQIEDYNQNNFFDNVQNNMGYNENYLFEDNNEYNTEYNINNDIKSQNITIIQNKKNNNNINFENKKNELYDDWPIIQADILKFNESLTGKINDELTIKLDKNHLFEKRENIILYYITNIDYNEENIKRKLLNDLFKLKVGNYEFIKFPTISYDVIMKRIETINYNTTLADNKLIKIIKNFNFSSINVNKFDYDDNIFYSQNKMSLYLPHILKEKKDIKSIFLNEEQKKYSIFDFQYIYSHLNNHIFRELLEKRISQLNNKDINENICGFYKGYMYTIMDKEIVERKINDTNLFKLKQDLLANQSENYYFTNTKKALVDENFFILSDNIQYLKGLSYEEVMLYIILERLKDFKQLPNIIFYECYMNIMGQNIIISDKNLLPGYQEVDFALYSNQYLLFDQKESPFYVQTEYYYNKDKFVIDNDGYVFKIFNDRLYFFEFKYSLNYFKNKNDSLQSTEDYKNRTKNPNIFITKLIKKCMDFKDLYVNKLSIPKDTKIEIIIFYDDNISKIFDTCLKTIENELYGKNITLSLIYVLSSYPFYSMRASIEENKKFKQEHADLTNNYKTLQNEYSTLQTNYDSIKKENETIKIHYKTLQNEQDKLKHDLRNLQERLEKMEKEKAESKNNDENKIKNNTEKNEKK